MKEVNIMAKLDNILAILWMLSSDKKVTAKQISDKLEMNIRTVYRYMDTLSKSGVPIISDTGHNGGYTLLNDFIEAPLFFLILRNKQQFVMLQILQKKRVIMVEIR